MAQLVTFGIPQLSGELSSEVGKSFVQVLARHFGSPIALRVCANYSELGDSLAEGRIDFAWLPPLEAAQHDSHGVGLALLQAVRGGKSHYFGVLFVREDSPARKIEDLRDKTVAFVHRRSASGYVVAASLLKRHGVEIPHPPTFLYSHGAVVQAVAEGRADAGATFGSVTGKKGRETLGETGWEALPPAKTCPMRALGWDGPIPSDAICAWPGTSRGQRAAMVEAFEGAHIEAEGKALMVSLFGTDRFEPADREGFHVLGASLSRLFPRPPSE